MAGPIDRKAVIAAAKDKGWQVDTSNRTELVLTPPDGLPITVSTQRGSKGRAAGNVMAELRRWGLQIDGVHETTDDCAHSWHLHGEPGRCCPYCRGTWRVEQPEDDDVKRNMRNPPLRERLDCPLCPEWFWVNERDAFEYHVASHDEADITASIQARAEEKRKKKAEAEAPPAPEPEPEPKATPVPAPPEPKEEPAVAATATRPLRAAPPAPEPETRPADETITYEVATIDGKGRLVLRDDKGELYIAVPLVPSI